MKLIELINNGSIGKTFLYSAYLKIVKGQKKYESISKKKIADEIIQYYSNVDNLISICTLKELKFLKLLIENKSFDRKEYNFEINELIDKLVIFDNFNVDIFIYDELIDIVEKALESYDEAKLSKDEKVVIPFLGYLKTMYCIHENNLPLKIVNSLGFDSVISLTNYLKGIRLFNYYASINRKLIISLQKEDFVVDIVKNRRKELNYPYLDKFDIKKYENIFYYDLDIDNKMLNNLLQKLKFKEFHYKYVLRDFLNLVALNFKGGKLISKLIEFFPYYEKSIEENKDTLIKIAKEIPCALLNGYSDNEYYSLVGLDNKDRFSYNLKTNLSKEDVSTFYKIMYAYIDYTNKRYNINPKITTTNNTLNNATTDDVFKLLDTLWSNIDLLSFELIRSNKYDLTAKEKELAKDFKKSKRDKYMILRYEEDGTIMCDSKYIYKVKGLIEPIQNVIGMKLPVFVEATLLEFKNQIIYDGFLFPFSIDIGNNIAKILLSNIKNTKIITSFEQIERKDKKWLK